MRTLAVMLILCLSLPALASDPAAERRARAALALASLNHAPPRAAPRPPMPAGAGWQYDENLKCWWRYRAPCPCGPACACHNCQCPVARPQPPAPPPQLFAPHPMTGGGGGC